MIDCRLVVRVCPAHEDVSGVLVPWATDMFRCVTAVGTASVSV